MEKYNEGLVIGKFYPPHLGHKLLIDAGAERSNHLTVLVMGTLFDTVSVEDRASMIREIHSDQNVTVKAVIDHVYDDYESDGIWKAHNTIIENRLDASPDAVFSSENYGAELAEYFHADNVCVDIMRKAVPISATAIRKNLHAQWRHLHPVVQDYFRMKVVVMGGESTGSTTLATALAKHYKNRGGAYASTAYVPEYGREYAEERIRIENSRDISWGVDDFWNITAGQEKIYESALQSTSSPVIICDTDALATEAFGPYYGVPAGEPGVSDYGFHDGMNKNVIYLITDHENMPLEDDGSRLTDMDDRNKSTKDFINVCNKYKVPYALVTGTRKERLEIATRIVDRMVELKSFIRPPV